MNRRKPVWPSIPAGFVRAVLAGHSALGLAFAALIFLVCFSGTAAVFIQDIQRWERPTDPQVAAVTPQTVEAALNAGLALTPDTDRVVINPPIPGLPRFTLTTWRKDQEKMWALDAAGRPVAPLAMPWTDFVQDLHIYLHLPRTWGMFVVGLTGVALLSSLVSGLLAHPRIFRDAFHFRLGGSARLQEADLHNRLGVWALPFHVTLSLTGALLGLSTVIVGVLAMVVFKGDTEKAYALFATPEPAHDTRPAPTADVGRLMAQVQALAPGSRFSYVIVEDPRQADQHISFGVEYPTRLSRVTYSFNRDGVLLGGTGYGDRNLGEGLYSAIGPAHFGWFGGGASKLAYGLLGMGLCAVTSSGVSIWLARRRAKGRPAPRWERVWIAAVWSQPLAYGVAALGVAAVDAPPLPLWAILTLASLALGATPLDPRRISRGLRSAAAAALALAAATHWARLHAAAVDTAAWRVDVGLAVLALALVGPEWSPLITRRKDPAPAPQSAPAE